MYFSSLLKKASYSRRSQHLQVSGNSKKTLMTCQLLFLCQKSQPVISKLKFSNVAAIVSARGDEQLSQEDGELFSPLCCSVAEGVTGPGNDGFLACGFT